MLTAVQIYGFDSTSGLPPQVVAKLNNNFWNLRNALKESPINIVSSVNPPEPRTDEAVWYKTDTGDLYIWGNMYVWEEGQLVPKQGWKKLDASAVVVKEGPPTDPGVNETESAIWYDHTNAMPYIWYRNPDHIMPGPGWISLHNIIKSYIQEYST